MKQIVSNVIAASAVIVTLFIAPGAMAQGNPQSAVLQSDTRPACCIPKPTDASSERGRFVTQGKATFWVPGKTAAKPKPACCAGGNCCANGACCSVAGCCKSDKSCCDPAKGVCTDACGCPKNGCCDATVAAAKTCCQK